MKSVAAALAIAAIVAPGASAQILGVGNATVQTELTDQAPGEVRGELKRGVVLGQHSVRATAAVILEAELKGFARRLPAGTVLGLTLVERSGSKLGATAPTEKFWCDLRPMGMFDTDRQSVCLQDTNDDLQFDNARASTLATSYDPFSVKVLPEQGKPISVAYRVASPEERPVTLVGYQYCGREPAGSPPRFASVVRIFKSTWSEGDGYGRCEFGVWERPGEILSVDRLRIRVSGEEKQRTFEVLDRIPAAALARLEAGRPIRLSTEAPSAAAALKEKVQELAQDILVPAGPPQVGTGSVRRGDALVALPVRHGITGVLRNRVAAKGLLKSGSLEAGQKMFGVPMLGTGDAGMVWCAPRLTGQADKQRWSTVCLPSDATGYRWLDVGMPFFVRGLSWAAHTSAADAPTVERQFADVTPGLELAYRFIEWDAKDADVHVVLKADGQESVIGSLALKRQADGSVLLKTLGGTLRLSQAGADRHVAAVEVVEPLQPGARLLL